MIRLSKFWICILLLSIYFVSLNASNKEKFEWKPVSDADWIVDVDSSYTVDGVIVLLEEIKLNDTQLQNQHYFNTVYKKMRIINDNGRSVANLKIPYMKSQKFKEIKARSIQKDGTITEIKDSEIYVKTIYKQKRKKIYQKVIFIPGVTDDCIIEYYVKIEQKSPTFYLPISSEYYKKKSVYTWNFYRGAGISKETYQMNDLTPNYLCINCDDNLQIEKLPSLKNTESLKFTTIDQKPFESEEYTLPDPALNSHILLFYAGNETATGYWGDKSATKMKSFQKFGIKDNKILPIVDNFRSLPSDKEKIEAAYNWLQNNIKNLSYDNSNEKFKDIDSVNDLVKYRYGYGIDINKTFFDMLQELDIESYIVYAVDRDENIFQTNAKYWQFDHVYVMVTDEEGIDRVYNPGLKLLPCGEVPWYNEGVTGLLCGDQNDQFVTIPFSSSYDNTSSITANLVLKDDFQIKGSINEEHTGEFAYNLRKKFSDCTPREQLRLLEDNSYFNYPLILQDSFKINSSLDKDKILTYQYNIEFPIANFQSANLRMFRISDLLKQYPVHFKNTTRKYPLIFKFANTKKEIIYIKLPDSYSVKALPDRFSYSTQVGKIQLDVSSFDNKTIQIIRTIELRSTYLKPEYFDSIYQFSKAIDNLNNDTIVLQVK